MIKLQEMTPEIYYKQSRDFQFIGRLFDIALNSIKANVELLKSTPLSDNTPDEYLDLVMSTLGIKLNKNRNIKQLRNICEIIAEAIKKKGTRDSIKLVLQAILNADGISEQAEVIINSEDPWEIDVYIPSATVDITIFYDLLNYIFPAGLTFKITRSYSKKLDDAVSPVDHESKVTHHSYDISDRANITMVARPDKSGEVEIFKANKYYEGNYVDSEDDNKNKFVQGVFTNNLIYRPSDKSGQEEQS